MGLVPKLPIIMAPSAVEVMLSGDRFLRGKKSRPGRRRRARRRRRDSRRHLMEGPVSVSMMPELADKMDW
jgi:hypothetical protein